MYLPKAEKKQPFPPHAVVTVPPAPPRRQMSTPTIASGAGVTSSCVVLSAVLAALAVNHLPLERLVIAQHGLFSAGDLWVQHPSPASRGDAAGAEAADVAVVLGYSVEEDGAPTPPLVARVELGVRLFASGAARNLMFSG